MKWLLAGWFALVLVGVVLPAEAALPPDFTDSLVASVSGPTALAFLPDGRLLVAQQGGALRVIENGALLAAPALDPGSRVCANSERGLLGVAVDPQFEANRFVYLYYTFNRHQSCPTGNPSSALNPSNRVSRFVMPAGGDFLDAASELVLIDNIPSPAGNHNGGDLQFDRDRMLYVSVGDGGCDYALDSGCAGGNDAARDRHALVGKILRITRDGGIPENNPFTGAGSARCNSTGRTELGTTCREIFATGLRNPFRIAFDPNAALSRFFINDVGQNAVEEIDDGVRGADYGWNCREGNQVGNTGGPCSPLPADLTPPIFSYQHGQPIPWSSGQGWPGNQPPRNCDSITGGAFVPEGLWPGFDGAYLFGDFVCGGIFALRPQGPGYAAADFATSLGASSAVTLRFGPPIEKSLYYTTYAGGGQVRRITYTGAGGNHPPVVVILAPAPGDRFSVGQVVTLQGSATDAEDGTLPGSALSWAVLLHHNDHDHPVLGPVSGATVTFTAPPPEELAAVAGSNLEIRLTATDSAGLETTVSRMLQPRRAEVNLQTSPPGLRILVNGTSFTGPATVPSWAGYQLTVDAPAAQAAGGNAYLFDSWSDGGARRHAVTTPAGGASLTAAFSSPADDQLQLNGGRFHVAAAWRTATASGAGHATALTGDSGFFWYFSDSNVELIVKVLDGCGLNQRYWLFAGGLTNVETTISVLDTETGLTKSYFNPLGTPFAPIQDTGAFATCP